MIPQAVSAPTQTGSISSIRATVSSTAAQISAASRISSSRLTCRGRSATTAASARDPGRPARTSASTRARETEFSAASAAANTPASGTSRTAMTIRPTVLVSQFMRVIDQGSRISCPRGRPRRARRSRAPPGLGGRGLLARGPPVVQQLALQAEHLPLLLRLAVVVAEQVQHAVHGEQLQLVGQRVPGGAGLLPGELRAQHDVAEQRRTQVGRVRAPGLLEQLVHRERHHVGRAGLVHPALVQLGHRVHGDRGDAQLGGRADPHRVQRVPRDGGDQRLVHGDAGLVVHLDRHPSSLAGGAPPGSSARGVAYSGGGSGGPGVGRCAGRRSAGSGRSLAASQRA